MRILWALVLAVLITGCDQAQNQVETPSSPIRVGTNVWPGYEPLYLARQLEGWPQAHLSLVEYPSASEVLRAFRNKTLEAASLTLDEVLLLRQQGVPVKVVLVHDVSEGGDVIVARQGIASMSDLKGKRMGVEAGALGAYVLTRALELNQMSLDDIVIVNRDVNMHESAMQQDEVDAVVTFEPVRTRLLSQGGVQVFDSRQIPNEIVDVLVVHEDVLTQRPEAITALVERWFFALSEMKAKPAATAAMMANRLAISADEVMQSYDGLRLPGLADNRQMLGGVQPTLMTTAQGLNRVMLSHQLLSQQIDTSQLFTDRFLPKD